MRPLRKRVWRKKRRLLRSGPEETSNMTWSQERGCDRRTGGKIRDTKGEPRKWGERTRELRVSGKNLNSAKRLHYREIQVDQSKLRGYFKRGDLEDCGQSNVFLNCSWECKLAQSFRRAGGHYLSKALKIYKIADPEKRLQGTEPQSHKN